MEGCGVKRGSTVPQVMKEIGALKLCIVSLLYLTTSEDDS
jgi:hypothetical protein